MNRKRSPAVAAIGAALLGQLAPSQASAQTVTYSHDSLGRVVDALYPDGTCLAYSYDGAGNRTQYTSSTSPGVVAIAVSASTYASVAATLNPLIGNPTCGTLTISTVGTPHHGTAAIGSGSTSIIYTPTSGYTGSDTFTYKVTNGTTTSGNGTVTMTVLAPTLAPVALNANAPYRSETPPVSPTIVTYLLPPDLPPLISDPYGYALTITGKTNGVLGTVSLSGTTLTYQYTGTISGTKAFYDSYTYTVSDAFGNPATATVFVSIVVTNEH